MSRLAAGVVLVTAFEPPLAPDGPKGLALAAEFHPEVVLLDIGLPGVDGYEVARRLRESPNPPRLLVALTGYGNEEDRRRTREAGFDLHLTKPVAPQELRRILNQEAVPIGGRQ